MASLRELQARFARALGDDAGSDSAMQVYRDNVRASRRNALAATYPVVCTLVGRPFFDAAVDAYGAAQPPVSGDLNVYGRGFGDFLAAYVHAAHLPYLGDVARLEWAIDEAARAADFEVSPQALIAALTALASDALLDRRFALHPSCRVLASHHPAWRIWRVHQPDHCGDMSVAFTGEMERVLVHRERDAIAVEQIAPGEFALLEALLDAGTLAAALTAALAADAAFDLAAILRRRIDDGTIVAVRQESPAAATNTSASTRSGDPP